MLIILRHQSYSTSTHTNCLIQFVKERFDQVFRLNRGRTFYSSLSICQAVLKNFSFLLNRLEQPWLNFFRFGVARILPRRLAQSSCFSGNFLSISTTYRLAKPAVRLSEARILHEHSRL